MPRKDSHHDIVVRALKKAGWEIVKEHKFYAINEGDDIRRIYIDVHAKHEVHQMMLFEIKQLEVSPVHELMELVGQFIVYRAVLEYLGDPTKLYVIISDYAYKDIILHPLGQKVMEKVPIPFVIYDETTEELLQWIPEL